MKAWIYIIIAAIITICWSTSLKYIQGDLIIKTIKSLDLFNLEFLKLIIPLIGYFIFGLTMVIFISKAAKILPMSVVYAVWMGLSLVFQALMDVYFFHDQFTFLQILFIVLVIIGVIGMKQNTQKYEANQED